MDGALWFYNCAPATLWDISKNACQLEDEVVCTIQAKNAGRKHIARTIPQTLFAGISNLPSFLSKFDFGSLTESQLRKIEKELIKVGKKNVIFHNLNVSEHDISVRCRRTP